MNIRITSIKHLITFFKREFKDRVLVDSIKEAIIAKTSLLPTPNKQIIQMRLGIESEPRSIPYIADILDMKTTTVRSRHNSILRQLIRDIRHQFSNDPFYGISVRTANCLNNYDIRSWEDLSKRNSVDLIKWRNLGQHSIEEIISIMRKKGLKFADEESRTICPVCRRAIMPNGYWTNLSPEYLRILENGMGWQCSCCDRVIMSKATGPTIP